ncbi:unnamed protein product, partial [marine sediment metagenome]
MNAEPKWGISEYLRIVAIAVGVSCIVVGILMVYQGKVLPIANISISAGLILLMAGLILIIVSLVMSTKTGNQQTSLKAWHVVVLILIAFLIIYAFTRYQLTEAGRYRILVDLIFIMLALTGAVGYGVYRWIARTVEARAEEITVETKNAIGTQVSTSLGYVWYQHHKKGKTEEKKSPDEAPVDYLKLAIDITRKALEYANKLDEQRHEELICVSKNNLAYYLAEKKRIEKKINKGDKELARAYAKYIYDRIEKYPHRRSEWADTYQFVMS